MHHTHRKKPHHTHLISISSSVVASRTISRMHGGGVMGRRSCALLGESCQPLEFCAPPRLLGGKGVCQGTLSPKPHIRARTGCCDTCKLSSVADQSSGTRCTEDHSRVYLPIIHTARGKVWERVWLFRFDGGEQRGGSGGGIGGGGIDVSVAMMNWRRRRIHGVDERSEIVG